MAGTFAEIMAGAPNVIDNTKPIVDEFVKSSYFLEKLPIKEMAIGNGNTGFTYQYGRWGGEASAATRAINAEYTESYSTFSNETVKLAIFGGHFEVDRVLAKNAGLVDWISDQVAQKVQAAIAKMNDLIINGDISGDANAFDGLDAIITDNAVNDFNTDAYIDMSTSADMTTNQLIFADKFNEALDSVVGGCDAILTNAKGKTLLKNVGARLGLYTTLDGVYYKMPSFADVPIINLEEKPGSANPVIEIGSRTIDAATVTNLTDFYFISFGSDKLHGVAPVRNGDGSTELMNLYIPSLDFMKSNADVLHKCAVEMVLAIAVEKTKSIARLKNIKVW